MTISRRQFLRGKFSDNGNPIRPPWSLPEDQFIQTCSRCSECIARCPEHIIKVGSGGYPEIIFNEGGCTFCGECTAVCEDQALRYSVDLQPWKLTASVSNDCISLRGITCNACKDACDDQAIVFNSIPGGISGPEIKISLCTGCGFCVYPCPVRAITLTEIKTGDEACQ